METRTSYRDVLVSITAGPTPAGDYAADVRMPVGTNPRARQGIVRSDVLATAQANALTLVALGLWVQEKRGGQSTH